MKRYLLIAAAVSILALLPLFLVPVYYLHLLILVLIWSFIGTSWSLMGKFGIVSLGHGGFLGIGVYATPVLWHFQGLTPWIGSSDGQRSVQGLETKIGAGAPPLSHPSPTRGRGRLALGAHRFARPSRWKAPPW